MSAEREAEVLAQIERAKAALLGTGEQFARSEGGRPPARSDQFKRAREQVQAAEQARNRLLVELVGDADTVPVELAQRLGLTGREAVNIVHTARSGSSRMKDYLLGQP
ncbi:hypothetical protein LTT66_12200 [Nocardia gipuzkoensis]|uniref:hypothetical protein n=1 Tax=Nocardia TaxID=1817 RepID=UPI000308CA09|nr:MULTISPECIES: hypothetical protein [Nocardia]UGT70862.1 hypothetical protein LTT66_12200 [Nocardia gipuzkoensis]